VPAARSTRDEQEVPMPTEAKKRAVAELRDVMSRHRTLIVSEYRGLSVREIGQVRRDLRRQDVAFRVVKNRLVRIAAEGSQGEALVPLLTGPTAIAFGDDEAATARAVVEALRPFKVARVAGGVLGDRAIDAESVARLAALPSREVLLGQLAGGLVWPIATLGGLLGANLRNLASALAQVRDRKVAAEG
jgi:large subunit ribosomal protein L10